MPLKECKALLNNWPHSPPPHSSAIQLSAITFNNVAHFLSFISVNSLGISASQKVLSA